MYLLGIYGSTPENSLLLFLFFEFSLDKDTWTDEERRGETKDEKTLKWIILYKLSCSDKFMRDIIC